MCNFLINFSSTADVSATVWVASGSIGIDPAIIVVFAARRATEKSIPIRIAPKDA